jgi:hypothetical protein
MMIDLDTAVFNPAAVFADPQEIVQDTKVKLSLEQKIRALNTWRYDIQLRSIAEEENMHSNQEVDLLLEEKILAALQGLEQEAKLTSSKTRPSP